MQCADRGKIQIRVAPLHDLDRLEGVRLERLHHLVLKRRTTSGTAEGAVARGAAGAAGDLCKLRRIKLAKLIAVELAVGGEGDMIDIEIETHADGVGRHQVVDLAGLIERDLGVAGARRQRAEHDSRAAALAPNKLGDRVNLLRRERDDGRTARQPRQLLLPGKGQLREPGAADNADAGQQPLDDRPHGRGAEHQSLFTAPPVQNPVGKDVAPVEIRRELNFIDCKESDVEIGRHRLDSGNPKPRIRRLDLLLAGDERHRVRADAFDRPIVDFARQKAQRQADQTGRVREHPLEREMGLAGVGRPEHGGDAGAASALVAIDGRTKGDRHQWPDLRQELRQGRLHLYHNNTPGKSCV